MSLGRKLKSHELVKNTIRLSSGTIVAQGVTILTTICITAFYSASEIGLLSTINAYVNVFAALSHFNFHNAITLSATDKDAITLAQISTLLSVFSAVAACIALFATGASYIFYLTPAWGIAYSYVVIATQFNLRAGEIGLMRTVPVVRAVTSSILQISLGKLAPSAYMLIVSKIVGDVAGCYRVWIKSSESTSLLRLRTTASKYAHIAFATTPSVIAHLIMGQSLQMMMFSNYGASTAGFFGLAQRISLAPSGLILDAASKSIELRMLRYKHSLIKMLQLSQIRCNLTCDFYDICNNFYDCWRNIKSSCGPQLLEKSRHFCKASAARHNFKFCL